MKLKIIGIIFLTGLIGAIAVNMNRVEPRTRNIHIESFRYGKKPNIIRCNRGDSLILTFSTHDTGHSFFLEEFGIDAKVSPGMKEVHVFDTKEPLETPVITREVVIVAEHPGIYKNLISKSQYRCHVWCGPLHAFEHGSLIILPNTLLGFGAGSVAGIFLLMFIPGFFFVGDRKSSQNVHRIKYSDKLTKFFRSYRIRQVFMVISLIFFYIIIIISLFGTYNAGRNLGSILVWIVWLCVLILILTPFFGKIWCYVCPIPFFGDLLQKGNLFLIRVGKTGRYNNKFSGLNLKWPSFLDNSWLMLATFLLLGTFSTTIVSIPRLSGYILLGLIVLATILALIFSLRSFCKYICPVNAFIGNYARIGMLALRAKDPGTCSGKCKGKFCELGNNKGWACPYGLNCENIQDSSKCGLCMECLNSCTYGNTSVGFKSFGTSPSNLTLSESFMAIALFTIAIVYSVVYHGSWSEIREYINIIDKDNYFLFFIFSLILWASAIVIFPSAIYLTAWLTKKLCNINSISTIGLFKKITNAITPLGLAIWAAFAIPLLLVNVTFILQSLNDPFGWGWNWLGLAGLPWWQILPQVIPWLQVILIIGGILLSIYNYYISTEEIFSRKLAIKSMRIIGSMILVIGSGMILFYTNF